jgi:hypothetical protein
MKLKRHVRRLLDRVALSDARGAMTIFSFSPLLLYVLLIELGALPRSKWLWGAAGIISVLLLVVVGARAYKWGRRFMRPVDKLRDDWARNNQSDDYR